MTPISFTSKAQLNFSGTKHTFVRCVFLVSSAIFINMILKHCLVDGILLLIRASECKQSPLSFSELFSLTIEGSSIEFLPLAASREHPTKQELVLSASEIKFQLESGLQSTKWLPFTLFDFNDDNEASHVLFLPWVELVQPSTSASIPAFESLAPLASALPSAAKDLQLSNLVDKVRDYKKKIHCKPMNSI